MINIADKILIGLHANTFKTVAGSGVTLPSATICPIGKTSGEKKKMSTIADRADSTIEYDNAPLPGFTLTTCGRRSWGSSQTIWKIIDPRGFTVEITSSNLENILHCTGITEGLIQEKCVWVREDNQVTMILMPVSSEDYLLAKQNTQELANKVSLRDVGLGDIVKLQNGLTGVYMGIANIYARTYVNTAQILPEVFMKRQIIQVTPTSYYHQSDIKVLSIIDRANPILTKQHVQSHMNISILAGHLFTTYDSAALNPPPTITNSYSSIKFISHNNTTARAVTHTLEEISKEESELMFKKGFDEGDCSVLLLESVTGQQSIIYHETSYRHKHFTRDSFPVIRVKTDTNVVTVHDNELELNRYTQTKTLKQNSNKRYSLDDFVKFYKIHKNLQTDSFI